MKRFSTLFLAVLMLLSQTGFTVDTHFCGGKAVKSGLTTGKGKLDCGMKGMDNPVEESTHSPVTFRKNCCQNKIHTLQVTDDYETPVNATPEAPNMSLLAVILRSFLITEVPATSNFQSFAHAPPRQKPDYQVRFQTFLI